MSVPARDAFQAEVTALFDAVDGLQSEVVDLDGQLNVANAAIATRDSTIANLNSTITSLNATIADLKAQLPPPPANYPLVASVQQNSGETWADAVVRILGYGYNGVVRYLPAGTAIAWDATFQALASKVGTQPINLQLTAKTYSDAGLKNVLDNLPAAWKPGFKFNYYQEPEDNLTDATSQAAYRATYTAAAKVLKAAGMPGPWVEWHEYAGAWDLATFVPPTGDFAGVLWSFFEYNERDSIATQTAHVQSMMTKYAPGKPWALMAGAYTLEPGSGPFTSAQLAAQAAWLKKMYDSTKAAGSTGWAWYNVLQAGTGGASGEARVEKNPAALSALKAFSA